MVLSQESRKNKNIESLYPLSPMQEGLLFHTLSAPDSGVYIEQMLLTFTGNLNADALKQSWQQVVQRHGALRTLFVWEDLEKPLQLVKKQADLPWSYQDWEELSSKEQQQKLEAFLREDRDKGFQLTQVPLMRCTLISLGNQTYKLILSFHHILIDGWCFPIIIKEVLSYYESCNQGHRCNLPPVRPYQDYILWLQQQNKEEAGEFWRQSLQGFTTPTPLVAERSQQQRRQHSSSYQEKQITLTQTTTKALQSLVREYHLTIATLVQAAWALLLSSYSGESEVLFGVGVSGRPANFLGVEKMVGLFMNTLPLRVQVPSQAQLIPWLQQLNQKQLQLQEYSYSHLVEIQPLTEIPAGVPLFDSILVFENYPNISWEQWDSGLKIAKIDSFTQTNYPLTIITGVINEDLLLKISYDTSRFEANTIGRMLGHLQTLLEAMVAKPNMELGQLPLMTKAELEQILVEWNNTKTDYPTDKCIHQLFEEQVEKKPNAIAVVFEQQKLTYSELNSKANQLAHYLQKLGVVPEVLVGICVDRSLEMIVALLAILKAGGAYVPLDPSYPSERLAYTLEDAAVPVLLASESVLDSLGEYQAKIVCLDTIGETITNEATDNPATQVTPENLAYVIYTSGSTGKPKGVAIEHHSPVAFCYWASQVFTNQELAAVLASTSICFDLSVFEIFVTLSQGGQVILAENALALPNIKSEITLINTVPSAITELSRINAIPDSVKVINLAGEPFSNQLVQRLYQQENIQSVYNLYGPSEYTTYTTFTLLKKGATTEPTIGRPIANTQVYILDSHLQPVPIGVPGELYISGIGIARGYLNQPELTEQKFIQNTFDHKSKLYKTGDLARYLPDGNIEFLGRIDNQVKIRGFRIELGEIESVLSNYPQVQQSVVLCREDSPGKKELVAYVVAKDKALSSNDLQVYLLSKLPEYMVPYAFVLLEVLPLTPNGKVDRKRLPAPDKNSRSHNEYVIPQTETEQKIANVWREVLQVEEIGIYDNFFELGGNSLLLLRVNSKLQAIFEKDIKVVDLFKFPSIYYLSQYITNTNDGENYTEARQRRDTNLKRGQVLGKKMLGRVQKHRMNKKE